MANLVSSRVSVGVDSMLVGKHRKTVLPDVECVEFRVTGLRCDHRLLKTQQSVLDHWQRFFIGKSVGTGFSNSFIWTSVSRGCTDAGNASVHQEWHLCSSQAGPSSW